jgi:hypothetical protein
MAENNIKDTFNKSKEIIGKKFDQLMGSENNVVIISFVIIFFILFSVLSWIYSTLSNKSRSCVRINSIYKEDNDLRTDAAALRHKGDEKDILVKNFFIKTAYNCCCVDGYKNNWVDGCALRKCIYQGARCLDFEIYSYNDEPIIAASTANNNSIKETYNYMKFQDVLNIITKENITTKIDNASDPLFLHFRIMSDNINIYKKMATLIKSVLFNNNDQNRNRCNIKEKDLVMSNINNLQNRYIIMVNAKNYVNVQQTDLIDYVNLQSGGPNLGLLRYQTLLAAGDNNALLKAQTKKSLFIVLPDLNNNIENYDWTIAYNNGCQFIAMKFQNVDNQLIHYNKIMFIENINNINGLQRRAIVLKPKHLIESDQSNSEYEKIYELGGNTKIDASFCEILGKGFDDTTKQCKK